MDNFGIVGEGAKCEGSNRNLEDYGAIMNGKEEGDKCDGTRMWLLRLWIIQM